MKRISALLVTLLVAAMTFAQGSVTVTQSSAISDVVNNNGSNTRKQQTQATPQKQQTQTAPQKQQTQAAQQKQQAQTAQQKQQTTTQQKPQTQQTQPASGSNQGSATESSATAATGEAGAEGESTTTRTNVPKPHTYTKQPPKKPAATKGANGDDELAEFVRERPVDYSMAGPKVMHGNHKIKGWRLQIFNGGNKGADKKKAYEMAAKLKKHLPNIPVYVHFYSPRWMTICGNYRTHKEAEDAKKQLANYGFRSTSIVRQVIIVE